MVGQRLCTSAAAAAAARCNICRHIDYRYRAVGCRPSLSAVNKLSCVYLLLQDVQLWCSTEGNWGLGLRPWPLCVEFTPHMHCPSSTSGSNSPAIFARYR